MTFQPILSSSSQSAAPSSSARPVLAAPLKLASGLVLPNRLAKAATSERLGDPAGAPTEGLIRLYERWGRGGAGLLITGNVAVDPGGREVPGNVVIEDERHVPTLRRWAEAAQGRGARGVMQLNHAGRQSPRSATGRPVAPSAVPLQGMFGLAAAPRALEDAEILGIVERFARAAHVAQTAGFAGVQVHAAHGYLLSQFLSPRTNLRTDRWGGSLENRMRLLLEIVRAVRARTAPDFSVSVKLNSADFQRGGFEETDALRVAAALEREGIDFLEISGGNYESPAIFGRGTTREREAYFLTYAKQLRAQTRLPLMLTGGLRSRGAMAAAVAEDGIDIVGLARPLVVEPDLPSGLLDGTIERALHDQVRLPVRMLDDLLQGTWYARQIRRLARGLEPDPELGRLSSVLVEGARTYGFNPLASA